MGSLDPHLGQARERSLLCGHLWGLGVEVALGSVSCHLLDIGGPSVNHCAMAMPQLEQSRAWGR